MSFNYLDLTNKVLGPFNEVQLTATSFTNTYGFYMEAQNYVNQAILDIYTEEDTNWPFAYQQGTFTTIVGQQPYTLPSTYFSINWDSFYTPKPYIPISSISLSGTTITVTTSAPHQILVADPAQLYNINDATGTNLYYNASLGAGAVTGWTVATVPSPTVFTFKVPASAPIPSLGTLPTVQPAYPANDIDLIDYNTYKNNYLINDINGKTPQAVPSSFNQPANVVRMPDNSVILTPIPDRVYTINYFGFSLPSPLVNYYDIPTVPIQFEQVIIDKALHYAYAFRDNIEEASMAQDRYTKNVNKMRRILIPQTEYMRFE